MALDKRKLSKAVKDKYSFANETFFRTAKSNPKDKIDVEIGDSKQPDFKPQIKIQRWFNEVNVSLRLKDDSIDQEVIDTVEDKIVWKKGKREAHFYDIQNAEHPDGAYEFEVVLLEKPSSNVVEFTIQDKDVEYLYQPALTPEEIADGSERPENVVGSYAIYTKTPKTNYVGENEYKVGKVGHIYRPRIEDSVGSWVWGELHIENGILSVTIPQEFLDNAVYPVRHAAGLTFGYTTNGASNTTLAFDTIRVSQPNTPASNGNVSSVTVYVSSITGGPVFRGVLYNSSESLVTFGSGITSGTSWQTANVTSASIDTSTTYWIGFWLGTANMGVHFDSNASYTLKRASQTYSSSTDPPSTFTEVSQITSSRYSIYATYTASGGSDPTPLRMLMGMGT